MPPAYVHSEVYALALAQLPNIPKEGIPSRAAECLAHYRTFTDEHLYTLLTSQHNSPMCVFCKDLASHVLLERAYQKVKKHENTLKIFENEHPIVAQALYMTLQAAGCYLES